MPKKLRYFLEYLLVYGVFALFGLLSLDRSSALGGWIGRTIGPRLAITKRARDNLAHALPELSDSARGRVIDDMWDNLGRIFGEYPHLGDIRLYDGENSHVEVIGAEHIDRLRDDGKGALFFSAHLGNWEIVPRGAARHGLDLIQIYRTANNPWVERLIQRARAPIGGRQHAKGTRGTRHMLRALKRGEQVAMLVDQKYNEGIAVPFFGRDAMTTPAVAELALRFQVPVIPARVERLKGARFRLTVYPALELSETGDREADVRRVTITINTILEQWIRDRPGQWLWLHRRWPNE
jgi:KDO2-lipid IV(A) lauroyltransferase